MEIFELWPLALLIVAGLVGLVVGSFLNVVAYRLPIMMELAWRADAADAHSIQVPPHAYAERFDLAWPPSTCPNCGERIAAQHNVPVLSFVFLRGRCARCGYRISARYPLVEAATAVLGIAVAYTLGPSWQTLAALGFTWTLVALTLIDLDHQLLPDSITLPLLWAGLVLNASGIAPFAPDLHVERDRRRRGYSESLDGLLAVQAGHRQGRNGLRRLQAARGDRRLGRLADVAARDPSCPRPSARSSASR